MSLIYRQTKGTPLTYAELDGDFQFLTGSINAISGAYATTGSNTFQGNQTFTGNITVSGTASVAFFSYISSSVIYLTGSNFFGRNVTDLQYFTGSTKISGSLNINGPTTFKTDTWNYSDEGTKRFYFSASNATYFESGNGYEFRNSGDNAILNISNTGQISTIAGITSSFFGTSSWASKATTSSYAITATSATTASYAIIAASTPTASYSISSSNAVLASSASYLINTPATSSYALQALSSSYATTSSYILNAVSSSYANNSISSSYATTSSYAAVAASVPTASYANNANLLDGLDSTIFATTSSNNFNGDQTITGSFNVARNFGTTPTQIFNVSSSLGSAPTSNSFNTVSASVTLIGSGQTVDSNFTIYYSGNSGSFSTELSPVKAYTNSSSSAGIINITVSKAILLSPLNSASLSSLNVWLFNSSSLNWFVYQNISAATLKTPGISIGLTNNTSLQFDNDLVAEGFSLTGDPTGNVNTITYPTFIPSTTITSQLNINSVSGSRIYPTSSGVPTFTGQDGQFVFGSSGGNYYIYTWMGTQWRSGSLL